MAAWQRWSVGGLGEVEQVPAFGVVELQGAGEGIEDTCRSTTEGAPFELGVVLHAHPGQSGDLAAAQAGDAALPELSHASLLGIDLGPPRGQEFAGLGAVIHVADPKTAGIDSDFPSISRGDCLVPMNDLDIRPRTRLSRAAALIPTTAAVLLATTLAVGTFDRVGPTTSPAPSVTQPAADSSGGTQVVLRLSDGTATATLNDTAAAQEFAALLPVQLTLRDPMGQAKSGRLPSPLPVADADRVIDPEVAGLYYWPPSGDIGIVYDDLGQTVPPPGMVQLGTVTSGLPMIASAGNRFAVSIERG